MSDDFRGAEDGMHVMYRPTVSHMSCDITVFWSWTVHETLRLRFFTVRHYALHGLSYRHSVRPSVCPSVRPSVTLVDCVHMVRPMIMISSPYGSPIILVSGDITYIPKFKGGHPEQGRWMRVGWVRIGDFRPISRRISETVRYDKGYYWSLVGNRTRAFDWYQNQRPWLTLKWPWAAIMHSVALHTCVSEPTTKIWMKIDPYYQRQKCSPGIYSF